MKKIALSMIALIAFAGTAFAKDSYEYKGGSIGKVTFNHKKHMALGCAKCHQGAPKAFKVDKAVGHDTLCLKCHKAEKKGPVGCKDCHKK